MRAPAFWWKPTPDAFAHLLSPFGAVYGAIAAGRMNKAGARVNAPVICVGNFVAGGAGKTPTAIALAQEIISAGHTPSFLSRGYGASRPVESPRIVDATRDRAADVGDEPLLLARVAPVAVCADRVAGARLAIENGANVLIMDDGLQNPALQKDFTIAVVDGAVGVGNGLCIPAGPLRAALDAQLQRTDALVIVGEGAAGARVGALAKARGLPVITARLVPDDAIAARLRGQSDPRLRRDRPAGEVLRDAEGARRRDRGHARLRRPSRLFAAGHGRAARARGATRRGCLSLRRRIPRASAKPATSSPFRLH